MCLDVAAHFDSRAIFCVSVKVYNLIKNKDLCTVDLFGSR